MSGNRSKGRLTFIVMVLIITFHSKECHSQDTCAVDTDPPVVTCSNTTTHPFFVNSFFGLTEGITYTYSDANRDPSGISYNVTLAQTGTFFPAGSTPVTLFARDICGNNATCLFFVEAPDNQEPVVTCPADFTTDSTTVTFAATVTDNFDPSPTLTYAPLGPGDTFPLGPTTVTVTATDSSSNQGTCSFTVTVVEPTTTTTTTAATTTTTQESNVGSSGSGGSGSSSSSGSSSEDSSSNESD